MENEVFFFIEIPNFWACADQDLKRSADNLGRQILGYLEYLMPIYQHQNKLQELL